ncbi:hypothetical protein D3C76_896660 [compost metagenome]
MGQVSKGVSSLPPLQYREHELTGTAGAGAHFKQLQGSCLLTGKPVDDLCHDVVEIIRQGIVPVHRLDQRETAFGKQHRQRVDFTTENLRVAGQASVEQRDMSGAFRKLAQQLLTTGAVALCNGLDGSHQFGVSGCCNRWNRCLRQAGTCVILQSQGQANIAAHALTVGIKGRNDCSQQRLRSVHRGLYPGLGMRADTQPLQRLWRSLDHTDLGDGAMQQCFDDREPLRRLDRTDL